MSWSRRDALLALGLVAGCGFRPALGPGSGGAGLYGDIAFKVPNSSAGYALARRLEERLGLPRAPAYELRTQIIQGEDVTGIPADRVTARTNLVGEVSYSVVDLSTRRAVRRGTVRSFTGYSSTSTTVATRTAAADAEVRLMTILADRIAAELLATAGDWRR